MHKSNKKEMMIAKSGTIVIVSFCLDVFTRLACCHLKLLQFQRPRDPQKLSFLYVNIFLLVQSSFFSLLKIVGRTCAWRPQPASWFSLPGVAIKCEIRGAALSVCFFIRDVVAICCSSLVGTVSKVNI